MRPQLEDRIRRQAITTKIEELRANAKVEILTDEVRSMVDRDDSAEAAGADEGAAMAEDAETDQADGDSRTGMGSLPAEPLKALP